MRKLDTLVADYPDTYKLTGQDDISKTYSFPKSYVSYRKPRAVSTGQMERARQMMIAVASRAEEINISGLLLPFCILTILSMALIFMDTENAIQITLAFCFGVFLHICLYYLLLMLVLPFLRQHISARACAVLWMLPNYLYLTQMSYMQLPAPRRVIEAPLPLVQVLLTVWLIGFVAVLGIC